ncbi:MAG: dual specificity protein phosphatase family protein [bacterium]|nr:dual specificity protein phosphatase family protein [bacterium]
MNLHRRRCARSILLSIIILLGLFHVWYVFFNYRFEVISRDTVYKSGRMPPEEIARFVDRYGIRTVVDLREPQDEGSLESGERDGIDLERQAIEELAGVRHINIPSGQVPTEENLERFFEVMDDSASYPVLIHCFHGYGRAVIYSAIYRIEYEGFSNEEARARTRFFLDGSSFDQGRGKGDFLIHYEPRHDSAPRLPGPPSEAGAGREISAMVGGDPSR